MDNGIRHRPIKNIRAAYQLHFHFCFQTKYTKPRFDSPDQITTLGSILYAVCETSGYHPLGHRCEPDRLLCLLSLKPNHVISEVTRVVKSNLSREFNRKFPQPTMASLWSIGYFVRSVGKASKEAAQRYIDSQFVHHGIANKPRIEVMRWVNPDPPSLRAAHVTFDLSYHVVLVTSGRADVFDSYIAPHLIAELHSFSRAEGFYIERMSVLYDHLHMLVQLPPTLSVEECVLGMMNDTCELMNDRFAGVLKATGAWNVWMESYYVATVGDATTAQIKAFLEG